MKNASKYDQNELDRALREERNITADFYNDVTASINAGGGSFLTKADEASERIDFLLAGNYGRGAQIRAQQVLSSPKLNRPAYLVQLIGIYEYQTPTAVTRKSWLALTADQKSKLQASVECIIKAWEVDQAEEAQS